jgi:hypothetical protein
MYNSKSYRIGPSQIHGNGLLAARDIQPYEVIGLSHRGGEVVSELGEYVNHSDNPTAVSVPSGNDRHIVTSQFIPEGGEISQDYRKQPELEQPEDFTSYAQYGGDPFDPRSRKGVRKNPDGSESTVIMRTETIDGINWISFPTLFENPDGSWLDLSKEEDWRVPMMEAHKRNEIIHFGPNKEAALQFGEGSWKEQDSGSLPKAQDGTELSERGYSKDDLISFINWQKMVESNKGSSYPEYNQENFAWYPQNYGQAFRMARDAGMSSFWWDEELKTTETTDDPWVGRYPTSIYDMEGVSKDFPEQIRKDFGVDMEKLWSLSKKTKKSGVPLLEELLKTYKKGSDEYRFLETNMDALVNSEFMQSLFGNLDNMISHYSDDPVVETEIIPDVTFSENWGLDPTSYSIPQIDWGSTSKWEDAGLNQESIFNLYLASDYVGKKNSRENFTKDLKTKWRKEFFDNAALQLGLNNGYDATQSEKDDYNDFISGKNLNTQEQYYYDQINEEWENSAQSTWELDRYQDKKRGWFGENYPIADQTLFGKLGTSPYWDKWDLESSDGFNNPNVDIPIEIADRRESLFQAGIVNPFATGDENAILDPNYLSKSNILGADYRPFNTKYNRPSNWMDRNVHATWDALKNWGDYGWGPGGNRGNPLVQTPAFLADWFYHMPEDFNKLQQNPNATHLGENLLNASIFIPGGMFGRGAKGLSETLKTSQKFGKNLFKNEKLHKVINPRLGPTGPGQWSSQSGATTSTKRFGDLYKNPFTGVYDRSIISRLANPRQFGKNVLNTPFRQNIKNWNITAQNNKRQQIKDILNQRTLGNPLANPRSMSIFRPNSLKPYTPFQKGLFLGQEGLIGGTIYDHLSGNYGGYNDAVFTNSLLDAGRYIKKHGGSLPKAQKGIEKFLKPKNALQLSSFIKGNKFEGSLSKSGHISISNLLQYVDKQSKFESAFVREQLKDFPQFQGKIDFNKFKAHLNNKLAPMQSELFATTNREFTYNDLGMKALGYTLNPILDANAKDLTLAQLTVPDPSLYNQRYGPQVEPYLGVDKVNTITFRNKYFGVGDETHFDKFKVGTFSGEKPSTMTGTVPGVYGHNRFFSTTDKPLEANLLEVQSDWGQAKQSNWIFDPKKLKKQQDFNQKRFEVADKNLMLYKMNLERDKEIFKIKKQIEFADGEFDVNMIERLYEDLEIAESMHEGWLVPHHGWSLQDYERAIQHNEKQLKLTNQKKLDLVANENLLQSELVKRNMDTRVLTETIQDLISKGYTSMNLPSWQTLAKIQGHDKTNWLLMSDKEFNKMLDNFGQSKIVNEEWKNSDRLGRLQIKEDGSVIDITNKKVIFQSDKSSIRKEEKEYLEYVKKNPGANTLLYESSDQIKRRSKAISDYRKKLQDKNTNEIVDYNIGNQIILRKYRDLFPKLLKNKFRLDFNPNPDKFKNDWKNYKFKPKWITGEAELPALEEGGEISSVYKEGYESLKDNGEIIADMMDNGAFLPKFKYGSEKQIEGILGRYNIKKEYDDTKNLPYVSYETESPGTFYDRIYYSGDDKKGNDDFSIIDMSSQIREQRIEHDRTKKLITAYDNNEEISKSGLDHLRNLGMLNTKKEKEEVVPSFVYKEPVVPIPLEQIKVSSDLRNKTNKEDKGIPIELQIEFYMAYVNGLFIGTKKEEKLKKIYDKLNRIYYNDARKSNMSVIDYMKSLNN